MRHFGHKDWQTEMNYLFPFINNIIDFPKIVSDPNRFTPRPEGFNEAVLASLPQSRQEQLLDDYFAGFWLKNSTSYLEKNISMTLKDNYRKSYDAQLILKERAVLDARFANSYYQWKYWLFASQILRTYMGYGERILPEPLLDPDSRIPLSLSDSSELEFLKGAKGQLEMLTANSMTFTVPKISILPTIAKADLGKDLPEVLAKRVNEINPVGQIEEFTARLNVHMAIPRCYFAQTSSPTDCIRITDNENNHVQITESDWIPTALNRATQSTYLAIIDAAVTELKPSEGGK